MPPADTLHPISLATAAVLTGRSMRTWQRRIEEGAVPRLGDGRGALVPFAAVRPALALDLTDEDVELLVRADQGDAAAQADVGARFALAALQEAEAGRGGDALVAPDAARGGAAWCLRCTSCGRRPSRARPTPCTGWGCCMRPGWARVMARRWR
ncbi:MAG: hypothetical protein LC129_04445 [Burkholderiales bacterium]|nr:hypothetical protein [Burkholderiales bacterium]